jgi:hypothetical protein
MSNIAIRTGTGGENRKAQQDFTVFGARRQDHQTDHAGQ